MFNWFRVILVFIMAAIFVIYTILAIKDTKDKYYLYDFKDFLLVFWDDHTFLIGSWCGIIIIAAFIVFFK